MLVLRCCECVGCMRVLGPFIRSKNFGCVAMCSAVLFILRSRLITSEMMLHVVIYNSYHLKS